MNFSFVVGAAVRFSPDRYGGDWRYNKKAGSPDIW